MRRCFLLAMGVALLAACTPDAGEQEDPRPSPVTGGRVEIGVVGEPATLDPYGEAASELTYALVRPVFPAPFRTLPDGTVVPELAESLEVTGSGARLVIASRQWSNGRDITAHDVVASIRRARSPSGFAQIQSARVMGARIVDMRGDLDDWEATLARAAFVLPDGRLRGGNVSGGPFRFAAYERGRSLSYEANPRWPSPPLLDELSVSFVQGTDLLVRLLATGDIDAAWLPATVNLGDRLDALGIEHASAAGDEKIVLNFDDRRVSWEEARSLVRTLDVERLVEAFVRDQGEILAVPRGPAGPIPATVSIAAPEGDELLVLIQRALRLDLEDAGITAELITAPGSALYGAWQSGGPADVLLQRSTGPLVDPHSFALARIDTFLAWRRGVNGLVVNPSLEGPLWNASEWSVEASI